MFHANTNQKRLGASILISDKIDFRTVTVMGDKEDHYIMIKEWTHQENITIIYMHPTLKTPKYIK